MSSACANSGWSGSRRMTDGSFESHNSCFLAYTRVFLAMRGIAISRGIVPSNTLNSSLYPTVLREFR